MSILDQLPIDSIYSQNLLLLNVLLSIFLSFMKGSKALALGLFIVLARLAMTAHFVHNGVLALFVISYVLDDQLAPFSHKVDELFYVLVLFFYL